ncbi:MAG: VOC family protein [Chloroflexota bacterium]|nr:VOC family protein [Chloroflexota bacterium]
MTVEAQHSPRASIDPATQVGLVSLTVADLERSVGFYTEALGFEALEQDGAVAVLGTATSPLLLLVAHAGARPWPQGAYSFTGLYHFAILLPTRAGLGRWLRHWLDLGYPLPGQGDHLVSEALYLSDPDGNGIEIYRDRPRGEWRWIGGQVQMATDPVDIRGLLTEAEAAGEPWTGLPEGTRIGHVHLQVGDIAQARDFYHEILGFDIVAQMPSALFVSAGGYHHHIGMNTWHSRGASPAPSGTAGLRCFTLELPSEEARADVIGRLDGHGIAYTREAGLTIVRDPSQNAILLQVRTIEDAGSAVRLAGYR